MKSFICSHISLIPVLFINMLFVNMSHAQTLSPAPLPPAQREDEIRELRQQLNQLSARLQALEASGAPEQPSATVNALPNTSSGNVAAPAPAAGSSPTQPAASESANTAASAPIDTEANRATLDFFHSTTLSFGVDGYYGYNFNQPIGRINQLRAYDFSSNSFSINQASIVVERLPQPLPGKRLGGRIDLQFGQATQTLQGSAANELHPEVWRNLFQAYGSYLAPVGTGLQLDFGKWSSALGVEGNYTKDQLNYSRSYTFNYLPFYHMGLRANYNVTSKVNVAYWLVNGAQQTDDFNGFKSQAFITTLKPAKSLTWNLNYYFGQEQRDSAVTPGTGLAPVPTPDGREHIFDTYATWTATPKLTLVGEADYVVNRVYAHSASAHVSAGAVYARYALPRSSALALRGEYLSDRGGLFSGTTQALKEVTVTADHLFEPGFLARAEYRRDFSNQPFFQTGRQGIGTNAQGTATLGLVFWWGAKQGSW